jgi:hypothetical protein
MNEDLACLYSSHPSLIAATQALAAKRIEMGSIYSPKTFLISSPATPGPNSTAMMTM